MKKQIQISDHFTYKNLLLFTLSPILTMVFSSIYSIVDGFFVSNYVGETPFASINLVFPYIMCISAIGFMFGSGGNALVASLLGQGKKEDANKAFSLIVYSMTVIAVIISAVSFTLAEEISKLLGATEEMMPYCITYLRINLVGMVFFMYQSLFQSFLLTEERPKLEFIVTFCAGCTNMLLDYLLVGVFKFGLEGAAYATIMSQFVGGGVPFIFFLFNKKGTLKLSKTSFDLKILWKTCTNGCSEFVTNITASLVGILYNLQLLKYYGEYGVSAYGVIMYVSFIFFAIFIGYNIGVSPIVSYNFGAKNKDELKNLFKRSIIIIGILGVSMFILSEIFANPLVDIFVGYNEELRDLTRFGFKVYSIAFLYLGINVFASAFFTALNDGLVSGIISLTRAFVLQLVMIYVLPTIFGAKGLWFVCPAFELCAIVISVGFLLGKRKKYNYL